MIEPIPPAPFRGKGSVPLGCTPEGKRFVRKIRQRRCITPARYVPRSNKTRILYNCRGARRCLCPRLRSSQLVCGGLFCGRLYAASPRPQKNAHACPPVYKMGAFCMVARSWVSPPARCLVSAPRWLWWSFPLCDDRSAHSAHIARGLRSALCTLFDFFAFLKICT